MSDTDASRELCPALRKDGSPCQAPATASGFCIGHSPRSAEWRVQGGQHSRRGTKSLRLLPVRLRPLVDLLMQAVDEVYAGTLDTKQATAMAALAGAVCRVFTTGELEERTRELERLVQEQMSQEARRWA